MGGHNEILKAIRCKNCSLGILAGMFASGVSLNVSHKEKPPT